MDPAIASSLPLTPAVFHIMLALADGDSHGYIEELPLQLDSQHDDERRRYYRLTKLGFAVARAEATRLAALVDAATRLMAV